MANRRKHINAGLLLAVALFAGILSSARGAQHSEGASSAGIEFVGSANVASSEVGISGVSCIAYMGGDAMEARFFLGSGTGPVGEIGVFAVDGTNSRWNGSQSLELAPGLKAASCASAAPCSSNTSGSSSGQCKVWMGTNTNSDGDGTKEGGFSANAYLTKSLGGGSGLDTSLASLSDFNDGRMVLLNNDGSIAIESRFADGDVHDAIPTAMMYQREPYSWDSRQCKGTRLGGGFDGIALSPDASTLVVAQQSALFQDGPTATYLKSSPARLLFYDIKNIDNETLGGSTPQLHLKQTIVYHVSPVLERPATRKTSFSSGIKAVVWLSDSELLVMENSFTGDDRQGGGRNAGRIFLLTASALSAATDVTGCSAIAARGKCSYSPVEKRLVATLQDAVEGTEDYFLGGASWGPGLADGKRLLVITNDGSAPRSSPDDSTTEAGIGARLLAFAVDPENLQRIAATDELTSESESQNVDDVESGKGGISNITALLIGCGCCGFALAAMWALFLLFLNPIKMDVKGSPVAASEDDEWWQRNRVLVMVAAHARNFLVSGVVYGYPALELILRSLGVYGELCVCGSYCAAQQEAFGVVSLAGFLSNIAARPLWGYLLDTLGPRAVTDAGMAICAVGIGLLYGAAGSSCPGCVAGGWACIGFGGSSVHMSNFHFQHMYPGNRKPISATFTMTFAGSAIMFTIWQGVYEYAGLAWEACLGIYLVMVLVAGVAGHFLQPRRMFSASSYSTPPVDVSSSPPSSKAVSSTAVVSLTADSGDDVKQFSVPPPAREAWEFSSLSDNAEKQQTLPSMHVLTEKDDEESQMLSSGAAEAAPVSSAPAAKPAGSVDSDWHREVRMHLRTRKYWAETLWYSIGILQFQWYIGTLGSQLYALGDESSGPVDAPNNFVFLKAANVFNALSGLWWPISAYMMRTQSFRRVIDLQNAVSVVYTVLLCVPVLELQTVTFAVQAVSRFLLFSAHHAFLSNQFPMKFFGVLNAVTYTVSSVFTFLIYPMQIVTVKYLGGSYMPFNVMFAAVNVASIAIVTVASWGQARLQTPNNGK